MVNILAKLKQNRAISLTDTLWQTVIDISKISIFPMETKYFEEYNKKIFSKKKTLLHIVVSNGEYNHYTKKYKLDSQ
jgi:hypothetical protein